MLQQCRLLMRATQPPERVHLVLAGARESSGAGLAYDSFQTRRRSWLKRLMFACASISFLDLRRCVDRGNKNAFLTRCDRGVAARRFKVLVFLEFFPIYKRIWSLIPFTSASTSSKDIYVASQDKFRSLPAERATQPWLVGRASCRTGRRQPSEHIFLGDRPLPPKRCQSGSTVPSIEAADQGDASNGDRLSLQNHLLVLFVDGG